MEVVSPKTLADATIESYSQFIMSFHDLQRLATNLKLGEVEERGLLLKLAEKASTIIPAATPTVVMLYQAENNEVKIRQAIDTSREQLSDIDVSKLSPQELLAFQGMMKEVVLPLMHPFVCLELSTSTQEDYNIVLTKSHTGLASDFRTSFKRCLRSLKYHADDEHDKARWEDSTKATFTFKKCSFWKEGGLSEFLVLLHEFFEEREYVLHSSCYGGNYKNFYTYRLNSKKCPPNLSRSARLWGKVFLEKKIPQPPRSDFSPSSSSTEDDQDEQDRESGVANYDEL